MKKITLLYSLFLALVFATACSPIEDRDSLGGVLSPDQLNIEVYAIEEGGNEIVLVNNTPGVGSFWDYNSGYSARQRDTILVPFLGDLTITFTGICDGGTVSKKETIKVEKMVVPVDEVWTLLAGDSENGKVWMWDYDSPSDAVWGNGATWVDKGPSWTQISAQDMNTQDPEVGMEGTMVFDLNQKANFTKKNGEGKVIESGTFQFDMSKTILSADGETLWSIGQLTIVDASVMRGVSPNEGGIVVHTLEILELTEDKMVLARVMPAPSDWEAWFWKFKVKK